MESRKRKPNSLYINDYESDSDSDHEGNYTVFNLLIFVANMSN
jgi:hypothetical protein